MRKLRIAYLCEGAFGHIEPYITFATEQGHEVCLIVYARPRKTYPVPTFDISRGARGDLMRTKWKYILAGLTVRRVLREFKPDLIHGHQVTSAGVICLLSGFQPYVLTAHGSDLMKSKSSLIWRKVLKAAFTRAAVVNTVSKELGDIAQEIGVPRDRILIAGPGIEIGRFDYRPRSLLRSPVRLLCTRTLADVYDPMTIVNACEELARRGTAFTLTFAAGGPLHAEIRTIVQEKGLGQHVRLLGGYDQSALPELLNDHDIYVSASRWDGTSLSLLEAMASGLAPIVSRIKSNQLWLMEGTTARMFDCGDYKTLANEIEWAVQNPDWFSRAGELNRRRVEEGADRSTNMAQLEEAYLQIANRGAKQH